MLQMLASAVNIRLPFPDGIVDVVKEAAAKSLKITRKLSDEELRRLTPDIFGTRISNIADVLRGEENVYDYSCLDELLNVYDENCEKGHRDTITMAEIIADENLGVLEQVPAYDVMLHDDPMAAARNTQHEWRKLAHAVAETMPGYTLDDILKKTRTEMAEIVRPHVQKIASGVVAGMKDWDLANVGDVFKHTLEPEQKLLLRNSNVRNRDFFDRAVKACEEQEALKIKELERKVFSSENMDVERLETYGDVQVYRLSFGAHHTNESYIKKALRGGFSDFDELKSYGSYDDEYRDDQIYGEDQIQVHRERVGASHFIVSTSVPVIQMHLDQLAEQRGQTIVSNLEI